jgi:hypothetical protein
MLEVGKIDVDIRLVFCRVSVANRTCYIWHPDVVWLKLESS